MDWLIKWILRRLRRGGIPAKLCKRTIGRLLRRVGKFDFCLYRCGACFEVRAGPIDHGCRILYAGFEGDEPAQTVEAVIRLGAEIDECIEKLVCMCDRQRDVLENIKLARLASRDHVRTLLKAAREGGWDYR